MRVTYIHLIWAMLLQVLVAGLAAICIIADAREHRPHPVPVKVRQPQAAARPRTELQKTIEQERARYALPVGWIEERITQENPKWNPKAFYPEPESKCYKRARTAKERKACGAYGLGQVICSLHWDPEHCDELFIPQINVNRIAKKLAECRKRNPAKIKVVKCYNGDGAKAEAYAMRFVTQQRKRIG